jgi:hypothetical protein
VPRRVDGTGAWGVSSIFAEEDSLGFASLLHGWNHRTLVHGPRA